jgi:hypothetical protein
MHKYNVMSGDISLVAATAKTAIQIVTGATRKAKIEAITLSFASVTSTHTPVLVELLLQTTAGTMSAATPVALTQTDPAALFTAQNNATVEPTASTVLRAFRVTPIGGTAVIFLPPGQEIEQSISTRIGLRLTAADIQSSIRVEVQVQE